MARRESPEEILERLRALPGDPDVRALVKLDERIDAMADALFRGWARDESRRDS